MVKKKKSWKNTLLNVLAVCLTIAPIFSVGTWAFTAFKGDSRQLVELASVSKSDNPKLFEEPLVSVTFDDSWETIYTNAMPIAGKYDVATTQYILPGMFTSPAYISLNQAKHMKEVGHEIASHTSMHSNFAKVNHRTVVKELEGSYKLLIENKLAEPNMSFAPPNGEYTPKTTAEAKKYYGSQRNVSGSFKDGIDHRDINIASGFDRYDIIGYTVGPYTTIEQIKEAIEYTKKHNGWLILVYHQIEKEVKVKGDEDSYNVTPDEFESHLKLIKESKVKTVTMREALSAYKGDK